MTPDNLSHLHATIAQIHPLSAATWDDFAANICVKASVNNSKPLTLMFHSSSTDVRLRGRGNFRRSFTLIRY